MCSWVDAAHHGDAVHAGMKQFAVYMGRCMRVEVLECVAGCAPSIEVGFTDEHRSAVYVCIRRPD